MIITSSSAHPSPNGWAVNSFQSFCSPSLRGSHWRCCHHWREMLGIKTPIFSLRASPVSAVASLLVKWRRFDFSWLHTDVHNCMICEAHTNIPTKTHVDTVHKSFVHIVANTLNSRVCSLKCHFIEFTHRGHFTHQGEDYLAVTNGGSHRHGGLNDRHYYVAL